MTDDIISRQEAIDELVRWGKIPDYNEGERNVIGCTIGMLSTLPAAQPEVAHIVVGCSRSGVTMWTKCNLCGEAVDTNDNYCRGCGRRFADE